MPTRTKPRPFISTRAAARALGISERTIRQHCAHGNFEGAWQPAGYHGRWLIPHTTIQEAAADLAETTPTLENDSTLKGIPTRGGTPMQTTDQITAQIAKYSHKLNTLEHQEAQHHQELAYLDKEQSRVRVLIELEEATPDDLDALKAQRSSILQQLSDLSEQVELARSAHAELHDRLQEAEIRDSKARHTANFEEYRRIALEMLEQLDEISRNYQHLGVLARLLHPEARHFQAISKAGLRATREWPDMLRHDIRRATAALERLQADEAVGA